MIRFLLIIILFMIPTWVCSQDFASRFRSEHDGDTALICVTISPKMIHDILESSTDKDTNIIEVISGLKSMQMCVTNTDGQRYYDSALTI